jgi:hypothetical protein
MDQNEFLDLIDFFYINFNIQYLIYFKLFFYFL